jgi:hypothetical protein
MAQIYMKNLEKAKNNFVNENSIKISHSIKRSESLISESDSNSLMTPSNRNINQTYRLVSHGYKNLRSYGKITEISNFKK